jgi:hypothetical protein
VITSRSAALVAGCGSRKPVPASSAPSMTTPVVGQLYFLEKRDARLAACVWLSGLRRRAQAIAPTYSWPAAAAPASGLSSCFTLFLVLRWAIIEDKA